MKYVVSYIDMGDSWDGYPRCMKTLFNTMDEARKAINDDFDETYLIGLTEVDKEHYTRDWEGDGECTAYSGDEIVCQYKICQINE